MEENCALTVKKRFYDGPNALAELLRKGRAIIFYLKLLTRRLQNGSFSTTYVILSRTSCCPHTPPSHQMHNSFYRLTILVNLLFAKKKAKDATEGKPYGFLSPGHRIEQCYSWFFQKKKKKKRTTNPRRKFSRR